MRSWPENGPKVLWTVAVGIGFSGPVVKDGKVYLLDRDDKGSMILADGLILSTDGSQKLYLIESDPSAFKPIATAELLAVEEGTGRGGRWASQNRAPLALADGKLLIRDQKRMKCVVVQ